jgi:aminoglycoside phosphotransferase (APT) family kinase protein
MPLTWLPDRSIASVRSALQQHAPGLPDGEIGLHPWLERSNPKWWHGSAVVDKRYFVKFAWSEPAAERVWYEGRILVALDALTNSLRGPRVIATSDNPTLLVTEWVGGEPLTFDLVGNMNSAHLTRSASELARFLADLHQPDVLAKVEEAAGPLDTPLPQTTTNAIRENLTEWIRSDQVAQVGRWCDWADVILVNTVDPVFVHGDFHGHNQLWNHEIPTLTVVLDYGDCGVAEAAYDFRYLPAQGPTTDLFQATSAHYGQYMGTPLDVSRVMAWHVRTVLGDALWRSRAGVPLPGGGTPTEWVEDLRRRFDELGMSDI